MWYKTKEEAEKACIDKKKKYETEFIAVKDAVKDIYWAVRKGMKEMKEMKWST